jgi:predicted ATPase
MMIDKIVLTGAPCSGKTSIVRRISMRGNGRFLAVPEVPTLFLSNGLTRDMWNGIVNDPGRNTRFIAEIVATRATLEDRFESVASSTGVKYLLCDRGLPDAASYLPEPTLDYARCTLRDLAVDRQRYSLIIHLESLAARGDSQDYGRRFSDPTREVSMELESRLKVVWAPHPGYVFLPLARSLKQQYENVQAVLERFQTRSLRNATASDSHAGVEG